MEKKELLTMASNLSKAGAKMDELPEVVMEEIFSITDMEKEIVKNCMKKMAEKIKMKDIHGDRLK